MHRLILPGSVATRDTCRFKEEWRTYKAWLKKEEGRVAKEEAAAKRQAELVRARAEKKAKLAAEKAAKQAATVRR